MKITAPLLILLLLIPCPGEAWIAYGFRSGMSRFNVAKYLSEKELLAITEGAEQTFAGTPDNSTQYHMSYCSSPQKLYRMKYRLPDSRAAFDKALEKYQKRYGKPEGLNGLADNWQSADWDNVDINLIWILNESETILLTHSSDGSNAEFQDVSVCD